MISKQYQTIKEHVREDYSEPEYNRYAEEEYPRTLGPEVRKQMTLGQHIDQQSGMLQELDKCIHALEDRLSSILVGHPVDTAKEEQVSNDSQLVTAVRSHNSYISSLIIRINDLRNNIQL
jgi:hypothetical protein